MLEWIYQPTIVHENNWKTLFTKAIGGGVPLYAFHYKT